ncbi:MAG: UbiA family prenyltransferase, partial [Candidatus Omnitrophota bacterium]|nr:UbiA family prenyltransferase [Candidatus Omnitrophota bacterium]
YLAFALFSAAAVGEVTFRIIFLYLAFYFLYSTPPFRLKRFFPLSIIIIATEALLAVLLGYLFLGPQKFSIDIPLGICTLVFFIFLLTASVKDLKDIEGDRITGVYTLPVLVGSSLARKIIGVCVFAGYLIITIFLARFFILKATTFALAFILATFNLFYIQRKDAKETVVFSCYLGYLSFLMLSLIVRNNLILSFS